MVKECTRSLLVLLFIWISLSFSQSSPKFVNFVYLFRTLCLIFINLLYCFSHLYFVSSLIILISFLVLNVRLVCSFSSFLRCEIGYLLKIFLLFLVKVFIAINFHLKLLLLHIISFGKFYVHFHLSPDIFNFLFDF